MKALLALGGDHPEPPAIRRLGEDTPAARLPWPARLVRYARAIDAATRPGVIAPWTHCGPWPSRA